MVNNIAVNVLGSGPEMRGTYPPAHFTSVFEGGICNSACHFGFSHAAVDFPGSTSSALLVLVNISSSSSWCFEGNLSSKEVNMTDAASLLEAASQSPTADITSV